MDDFGEILEGDDLTLEELEMRMIETRVAELEMWMAAMRERLSQEDWRDD